MKTQIKSQLSYAKFLMGFGTVSTVLAIGISVVFVRDTDSHATRQIAMLTVSGVAMTFISLIPAALGLWVYRKETRRLESLGSSAVNHCGEQNE